MDVVGVKKCFMTSLKGDLFFPPNNSSVFSYNDILMYYIEPQHNINE